MKKKKRILDRINKLIIPRLTGRKFADFYRLLLSIGGQDE
tara:strand:+ start:512 stop:631 length:120 start_codon:yes stop_codon:yes gene_type:complete